MSEWWTYRPSDFLLFSPNTYYRLFELYNGALWPVHPLVLAASVALLTLAWRHQPPSGRMVAIALALAWGWVAWGFHFERYATINWAALYFAAGFWLQALAFLAAALTGGLTYSAPSKRSRIALLVAAIGIVAVPLIGPLLGRPWAQIELAGLAPDPTAVATLGFLLAADRIRPSLFVIPLLWCLVAGVTLMTMDQPAGLVPLVTAASIAALAAARYRRRPRAG